MNQTHKSTLSVLSLAFPDSEIELTSPRNDDNHFALKIISTQFKDLSRIDRSRLVHQALADLIGTNQIHAITMTLNTPDEART